MIGGEIRSVVFRDTKDCYLRTAPDAVAVSLIEFAKAHGGRAVLDLGCATGNYCAALARLGFDVKGADVNPEYVHIARERGIDAQVVTDRVPFPDQSFDTVLLFEVLEHLADPARIVAEARRLARKNVLVTVPHCGAIADLQATGLLFEHFADLDHKSFYTESSLGELLRPFFSRVEIAKGDAINPLALFGSGWLPALGRTLMKLKVLRPRYHFRLYAQGVV